MSQNSIENLNYKEVEILLSLLARCTPGDLPSEIFEALARITVYPAVEFVLLRQSKKSIEVLLFERSDEDPVWPGMLHIPGTVLRPTDASLEDAFDRLFRDEVHGVEYTKPKFTGLGINDYIRGRGLGVEYWGEVLESAAGQGTFYDIGHLPPNFINEQSNLLERAARAFRQEKDLC